MLEATTQNGVRTIFMKLSNGDSGQTTGSFDTGSYLATCSRMPLRQQNHLGTGEKGSHRYLQPSSVG